MPENARPSVAVIIATRNAARELGLTLASLAAQSRPETVEVFVQDGNSGDATLAVARGHAPRLPLLHVASSPDNGVYDAWRKALPLVRAPWVLFLGAGDTLPHADTLRAAMAQLECCPGDRVFALGQVTLLSREREPLCSMLNATACMAEALPYGNPIYHAGVFTRSDFLKAHPFDPAFRILGDYDFFCRHWGDGGRSWQLRCLVAETPLGGLSNSETTRALHDAEMRAIRRRYFPLRYWTTRPWQACAALLPTSWRKAIPAPMKRLLRKLWVRT